jgi:hypothetical protein
MRNRTKPSATRGCIVNCPEQDVTGPVIPLAEPSVTKATGNGCEGAWRDKVPQLGKVQAENVKWKRYCKQQCGLGLAE